MWEQLGGSTDLLWPQVPWQGVHPVDGTKLIATQAIVKHTFLDIVDDHGEASLKRSASDGDLSRGSGDSPFDRDQCIRFWLPSLSSGSSSSGGRAAAASRPRQNQAAATWLPVSGNDFGEQLQGSHFGGAAGGIAREHDSFGGSCLRERALVPLPTQLDDTSAGRAEAPGAWFNTAALAAWDSSATRSWTQEPLAPVSSAEPKAQTDQPPAKPSAPAPQAAPTEALAPGASEELLQPSPRGEPAPQPPQDEEVSLRLAAEVHEEISGTVPLDRLRELARLGILAGIPRDASGELTSVGSLQHACKSCAPCAYWFKGICKYSILCNYCHLVHEGQKIKRLRPSKQTRLRMRKYGAQRGAELREEDAEAVGHQAAPAQEDWLALQ